ncbi:MAG: PilW family protein [Thermodesulfobacteriota bacterium]
MKLKRDSNIKGLTIIEILLAFVLFSILIAGIYRFFIVQSRAYSVQDHVVETQQGIRSSMEILLRDLKMAGFDSDDLLSQIVIGTPIQPGTDHITVDYEYDNMTRYSVRYWHDANSQILRRELTIYNPSGVGSSLPAEDLLENVEELHFTYGLDINGDNLLDEWREADEVNPEDKIVAVKIRLTARPQQTLQETQQMISPRRLETTVALRNQCLR